MDIRTSLAALGLLHIIVTQRGRPTTRADLARLSGRSIASVDRLTKVLERAGLLSVERRPGSYSVYTVLP